MLNLNNTTRKTRRTIDAVGVGLCLALTGLLYVVSVHPMLEQRREQQTLQKLAANEHAELTSLTASLTEIRQQYVNVQREVADNALRLEPLSALNQRVADLTAMARSTDLEVESVRPGRASASEHYRTVPVQVTGRGSFHATSTFLSQLHNQMPDVGVWSMQLDRRGDGPNANAQFQLALIWYASPSE